MIEKTHHVGKPKERYDVDRTKTDQIGLPKSKSSFSSFWKYINIYIKKNQYVYEKIHIICTALI